MLSIDDIIKLLEKLKEENATVVSINSEPIIEDFELINGAGMETIKYKYTIELEYEQEVRHYKKITGFREYID